MGCGDSKGGARTRKGEKKGKRVRREVGGAPKGEEDDEVDATVSVEGGKKRQARERNGALQSPKEP